MPCYPYITTKMLDFSLIEESAQALGWTIKDRTEESILLDNKSEFLYLFKLGGAIRADPSGGKQIEMLRQLTVQYTEQAVKKVLVKKYGFSMSRDRKNAQALTFSQYSR